MKQLKHWAAALILCGFWGSVYACPQAEIVTEDGAVIRLLQAQADGVYELLLQVNGETKSRLTYDGTADSACRFGVVAMSKGGAWGWHLAWADATKIYITRMDGEAWVGVPPKRFTFAQADSLKFQAHESVLQLTASSPQSSLALHTEDEGRSWDVAPVQP